MLKRNLVLFLLVISLLLLSTIAFASNSNIDKSQLENGLVTITYIPKKDVAAKVMITKGDIKYTYDIKANNSYPLQLGDGKYTVSILENVEGNKYRQVEKEEINLKLSDANKVFLQSNQIINWNENMEAMKKAKELAKNAKNDKEKVIAIYNFIINNISYDNDKAASVQAGYIPSIDIILKASKGICYDYATLFAAMLRSLDVPTKLVMGRKNDVEAYHAWNQVYLEDSKEWVTIDTTYDAALKKENAASSMIKDEKEYKIEKQY
ncbi:transglutaminase-like domain-containing protein [Proteiniborus sp. MB09-C3]|uniref:transglutaminase-like domain-containing protein n=1 Tax=Proteiniborus sp. MB09-C3 TaxID=3050072 RepID=UPI0025521BCD|nr:transglutaminase-like domain-containing protein [Proteiniborus sp. MB09-C3]WIV12344.1 transglutaminase-like domain-containing protein [Proteiniborus sp. MB09-C3]